MRGAGFALPGAMILLLGCTFPAPSEGSLPTDLPLDTCAPLTLATERPSIAAADDLAIETRITNCGSEAITLGGDCTPIARLLTQRSGLVWSLGEGPPARAATLDDACAQTAPQTTLAPGATRVLTFRWNGTFEADPCRTYADRPDPACPQWASSYGPMGITARAYVGDRVHVATTSVFALTAARVADPGAACGASFRAPEEIVRGEEARFFARFDNCGPEDVQLGDWARDPDGFALVLVREIRGSEEVAIVEPGEDGAADARVDKPAGSRAPDRLYSFGPRLVFAGGHAETSWGWNGTLRSYPDCDADCEPVYEDAPAGNYTAILGVTFADRQHFAANATVRVR